MRLTKENKYRNRITEVDGYTFDSKAEANCYRELKLLEKAKQITHLELQPKFEIIPSYYHPVTKRKIAASYYIADFRVRYADGREEVIDVKGIKTAVYMLKKKLFEQKYGIAIKEIS